MMVRVRSIAVVAGLLLLAGTAQAEISSGTSVFGNTQGSGTRGGLLNYNKTRFGVPDPAAGNKVGAMKVGGSREVSLAQGTTNLGPCEITGSVGSVKGELSAGVGATKDVTAGAPAGSSMTVGGKSPGKGGGGIGAGGLVQCNASVEANLVSVEATCKTAIGTIKPSVKGPGGSAGCSCARGCTAELYWAKAGIEYTTPAIGGCGIKASATVGAEVMAGVAAGAEKVGTVGGKVKLGPVGVTAGVNIEEFDVGKMGECVAKAAQAVADTAVAIANKAVNVGKNVLSSISNAGKNTVSAVSNFFGGLFGGGKKSTPTPPATGTIPTGTTIGVQPTLASNTTYTSTTITPGTIPPGSNTPPQAGNGTVNAGDWFKP